MSDTSYNLDRDLNEALTMAQGLESYVRGNSLYGNTGGMFGSSTPSLTVGALLMRLRRLHSFASRLSDAQRTKLSQIDELHDQVRRDWAVHYQEKMAQEGASRLKAMNTFFEECADRPRGCAGIYPPEALRRTIVQEIIDAMKAAGGGDQLAAEASRIDGRLRRVTQPNDFIWASELSEVYPSSVYWWLYAKPPQTVSER